MDIINMALEILGFTTVVSSVWNAVSYVAFVIIIVGVYNNRHRNTIITFGATILTLYAIFFLKSPLFSALQILIVVSGILQWAQINKHVAVVVMLVLTSVAYAFLYLSGEMTDGWALIGSFGLLGIAFGLITLPKSIGFLIMVAGGALLTIYAFHVAAWVFFFLNIFFVFANIQTWKNSKAAQ